ncbi:MAG: hypothetical protein GTO14_07320 [Anaerolineales bacterium]|nr:hypothetical protein [Anaerolineales bacterium]
MRMSQLFGRTLRQAPSDFDGLTGLALRAALVRSTRDRLVLLPLGVRVVENMVHGLRMALDDAQPLVVPPGDSLASWLDLISGEVQSYRQLPIRLYSRRAIRLSSASLDLSRPQWAASMQWLHAVENEEESDSQQKEWLARTGVWLRSSGLTPKKLEWQPDSVGWAHYQESGPEVLLVCSSCDYAANQQVARFSRSSLTTDTLDEPTRIATPGADTIEELSKFFNVPVSKTLKAVFLTTQDRRLVFVILRGDLEISIPKLTHLLGSQSLDLASEIEIRNTGAEPGYASPIGLEISSRPDQNGVLVVGDVSIKSGTNFITGANEHGFHLTGVNYPRDFEVTLLDDVAQAREGDKCVHCEGHLVPQRAIFLGGWRSIRNAFRFTDVHGVGQVGTIGLGSMYLEPIMAAVIDVSRYEAGIAWPVSLSPFEVHLVDLRAPEAAAQALVALENAGLTVLYDDREVSSGVKFADADLIGCALRVTVGKRSLEQGGAELSCRAADEHSIVPLERLGEAANTLKSSIM